MKNTDNLQTVLSVYLTNSTAANAFSLQKELDKRGLNRKDIGMHKTTFNVMKKLAKNYTGAQDILKKFERSSTPKNARLLILTVAPYVKDRYKQISDIGIPQSAITKAETILNEEKKEVPSEKNMETA